MKQLFSAVVAVILLLSLLLPCALAESENPPAAPEAAEASEAPEDSEATETPEAPEAPAAPAQQKATAEPEPELVITGVSQNAENRGLLIELESALANGDKKENYTVSLGGNNLEIVGLTAAEGAEKPAESASNEDARTSWIFLTDVSSVATNRGEEAVRDTLKYLITLVGENDNGAMVTTAKPEPGELATGSALEGQMRAEYDQSANQLYTSIATVLEYFESNEDALNPNKCLVVLSKGDDRGISDVTLRETVLQKIEASDVSVYTIAFSSSPSYNFSELAKASQEQGHGGVAIDYNNTGENIPANALYLISNDRKTLLSGGEPIPKAKYTLETSAPQEAGVGNAVRVAFADSGIEAAAEYTPAFEVVYPQKNAFTQFVENVKKGDVGSVAILAVAAVVLVLLIVLLIRKLARRKDKEDFNQGEVVTPPVDSDTAVGPTSAVTNTEMGDGKPTGETTPVKRRLQLSLREGDGKVHRAMMGPSGITAGRQGDNHIVLDSNDKHISRHHFELRQQGEEVVLVSVSETNGTYVNGMRISGPIALRQRDVVRVGSTELTVTWKYE